MQRTNKNGRLRIVVLTLASVVPLSGVWSVSEAQSAEAYLELEVGASHDDLETVGGMRRASAPANPAHPEAVFPLFAELPAPESDLATAWAYANEAGRVRASTTAQRESILGGGASRATTFWSRRLRKGASTDTARFTINRSTLYVSEAGASIADLLRQPPTARLRMEVILVSDNPGAFASEVLNHFAKVGFLGFNAELLDESTWSRDKLVFDFNPVRGVTESVGARLIPVLSQRTDGSYLYEIGPYTGTIDLGDVPVNGRYTIYYRLTVSAQNVQGETTAFAYLGDPLDVDSGFSLETDSTPVDAPAARFCSVEPDRDRYVASSDASAITDLYTGLTWQRCQAGATLDNQGTAADLGDDSCTATGNTGLSWQAALQRSTTDTTAGFNDWRVPNAKELDSIVESSCLPAAIDSAIFPRLARTEYWSSTPTPGDGAKAEAIGFVLGNTRSLNKTELADVRLVRDSGAQPLPPPPALSVGRPVPVIEGDGAAHALIFPVRLDVPAAADVTFTYQTRDASATAGSDYSSITGTAFIMAGGTLAEIEVPVLGDRIAEESEVLELVLSNVSSNARLRQARAFGQIDDDEPVASLLAADALEPQSGSGNLAFSVLLDKPAVESITFSFDAVGQSATAGQDFTTQTGQVTIAAGAKFATFNITLLPDTLVEGDEYLIVTLRDPSSHGRIAPLSAQARGYILDAEDTPMLSRLNDTTVDACAIPGGLFANFGACPQAAAPGQDAEHGRDFTLNSDTDGVAGFVFTKLDAAGTPLVDQTVDYPVNPWDCVQDQHTGLYWEVKTDNGGLRDKDWTYSWYNSSGIHDGGNAGAENLGACVDTANCDTQKFVAAVNAAGMCGFNDWRLPTRDELLSIVMLQPATNSSQQPAFDPEYFPNTLSGAAYYSTSTPRVRWERPNGFDTTLFWAIERTGRISERNKSTPNPLRLVRGAP